MTSGYQEHLMKSDREAKALLRQWFEDRQWVFQPSEHPKAIYDARITKDGREALLEAKTGYDVWLARRDQIRPELQQCLLKENRVEYYQHYLHNMKLYKQGWLPMTRIKGVPGKEPYELDSSHYMYLVLSTEEVYSIRIQDVIINEEQWIQDGLLIKKPDYKYNMWERSIERLPWQIYMVDEMMWRKTAIKVL